LGAAGTKRRLECVTNGVGVGAGEEGGPRSPAVPEGNGRPLQTLQV